MNLDVRTVGVMSSSGRWLELGHLCPLRLGTGDPSWAGLLFSAVKWAGQNHLGGGSEKLIEVTLVPQEKRNDVSEEP